MEIKKNKGWIVLLVVLVLWEIFTIASIKSQNENLERQINNMANNIYDEVSSIDSSIYDIKAEISEELEKQASLLSSHAIDIIYKDGLLKLDLSFIPKEYIKEEKVQVIFSSDKETKTISAINQDGIFAVKAELLPSHNINARVRFISEASIRQEKLAEINAADKLAFQYEAYYPVDMFFPEELLREKEHTLEDASDPILVSLFPFYKNEMLDQPYKDLESFKIVLVNRATSEKVAKVDLKKSLNNDLVREYQPIDEASLFIGDLSGIKVPQGNFRIDCELVSKEGLVYKFEVGMIDNYNDTNNVEVKDIFNHSFDGVAYPDFQ